MKTINHKYWILVASYNHVLNGVKAGIAQVCHGKAAPLRRMSLGDGIIYYSPKMEFDLDHPCQQFTAIGFVEGDEVFPYDMGNGFIPYRRKIRYIESTPVAIKPLISSLEFITDKTKWGYHFRFGAFEIMEKDFCFIAGQMNVNW